MFHIGVPLALFALLLPRLDRLLGGRVGCSAPAGVAAAPLFALSSFLMAQATNPDPGYAAYAKELAADVDSIRKLVEGKTIFVSRLDACNRRRDWLRDSKYHFAGSVLVGFDNRHLADFVVSDRIEGVRTLTPGRRHVFLYDRANHDAALDWYERQVKCGTPVLESPDYDVHLVKRGVGRRLLYFDGHCPDPEFGGNPHDVSHLITSNSHVFLHAWPYDANDLPADRRRFGFDDLLGGFRYALLGWRKDGGCYALCRLPDYGIARVSTGWATRRLTGEGPRYEVIWEGGFSPDQATRNLERTSP